MSLALDVSTALYGRTNLSLALDVSTALYGRTRWTWDLLDIVLGEEGSGSGQRLTRRFALFGFVVSCPAGPESGRADSTTIGMFEFGRARQSGNSVDPPEYDQIPAGEALC